jgi:1,4-dihydroxy-6-naphthoate synthase
VSIPKRDHRLVLRIGHSPDADDAFMWWPITLDPVTDRAPMDTGRFRFEPVMRDIETLNREAASGELEITAMSCAAYPAVRDLYAITACGASMGGGYGPKIIARAPMTVDDLHRAEIVLAVPGRRTSAFAAASLLVGPGTFRFDEVPFEQIIDRVVAGEFAAGLVIHEGQLTYEERGLHLVVDLGQWWTQRTGLPLPLGLNAIRRDLDGRHGVGTIAEVTATLTRSVQFALDHRPQALQYAIQFGSDVSKAVADRFVGLYVNQRTLDFGPDGRAAVRRFLAEAAAAGLVDDPGEIEFVGGRSPAPWAIAGA